ncbi:hypothetical protein GCM10027589_23860 [Actinocorallia lasiicapitis]
MLTTPPATNQYASKRALFDVAPRSIAYWPSHSSRSTRGDVRAALPSGRITLAHNTQSDYDFLAREFTGAGLVTPSSST